MKPRATTSDEHVAPEPAATADTCVRTDAAGGQLFGVPLVWRGAPTGYQCPHCDLYVAIRPARWVTCPACPGLSIEEACDLRLHDAGLDESDRATVLEALGPLLTELSR